MKRERKTNKLIETQSIINENSENLTDAFTKPDNGGHFRFSGGGLYSNGGLGSKSFNRFAVRPVG